VRCDQVESQNTVGKLFVKGRSDEQNQRDFDEELESNDLMREINSQGEFSITDEGDCYISGTSLREDERRSCAATGKDPEARSRTMRFLEDERPRIPQIIYKKGGIQLNKVWMHDVPVTRFLADFQNIMEGLVKLNDTGYAHADIKPANVLYNTEKGRANLIDFGHLGSEDRLYADSIRHLALLGHHYPYYPPEFKVLFMFCMGISETQVDTRILQKIPSDYLYALEEEFELHDGRTLDLPFTLNLKINTLYTRHDDRESRRIIDRLQKSIKALDGDLAPKYEAVLARFHHDTRLDQIKAFIDRSKEELSFDTLAFTGLKLAKMEKLFLNERFGAKIDVYSIGVCLMELVYDYLIPVFLGVNVSTTQKISKETHEILVALLYIISGMVCPDPFMRLEAREARDLYFELVHAMHRKKSNDKERKNILENIEIYMRDRIPLTP